MKRTSEVLAVSVPPEAARDFRRIAELAGRIDRALGQLLRMAELVEPTATVNEVKADPADNRVLEAAAESKALVIVSGDRHLLRLKAWRGVAIESPATFVARLGKQS